MPGTLGSAIFGVLGGLVGAIFMGIVMNLMSNKIKITPPKILAAKILGNESKDKQIHFLVMILWGLVYGLIVTYSAYDNTLTNGLLFSLIPWLVLGLILLPYAGAGLFGSKKDGKMWILTLVLHLIWGLAVWLSYWILTALIG